MLELIEKVAANSAVDGAVDDTVTLPYALRQKSRQRLRLDGGGEAAVMLAPGTQLDDGDRLRAADGTVVRVQAALEAVTTASSADAFAFARACYHLGNRHVPLHIGPGWVRYQPDHVLDDMVRGLGLTVRHESTPFVPERGAYHGQAAAHRHEHPDASGHPHADGHEHHH